MVRNTGRVIKALAREGIVAQKEGPVYRVQRKESPWAPEAQVLLPEGFPLEQNAVQQLAAFAAVSHPEGGKVTAACATPDFHAGATVPVGAVVATSPDLVIPQAIGTDIQCGMRLHVSDLRESEFRAGKNAFVERLKGDLLLGTRDLPMRVSSMKAMFEGGALAWLETVAASPLGRLSGADMQQIEGELERIYELGSYAGASKWAPSSMVPDNRDVIRDPSLATVGGGNHFVEVQVVEDVFDRRAVFSWGIKTGQVVFMVHSGSRLAGVAIGNAWMQRARQEWPKGTAHPETGIFPLYGALVEPYLEAMNSASNYASVNRLLLAELVRLRLREVFGAHRESPLLFDVPHNVVLKERGLLVHRKGATPAHAGQPVLIPGSMGQSSYLMKGLGSEKFLSSASHGAGRAKTRYAMRCASARGEDLGLDAVECITRKEERLIQEAPAAYKAITPVIEVQAEVGIVSKVARMRPLLTFKA